MNPWEIIDLNDYESHMQYNSVQQLQTLNYIMKQQIFRYNISTICILGIAGGNGLEHMEMKTLNRIYGVDINEKYLQECKKRYGHLHDVLELIHQDVADEEHTILPNVQLLIANLFVEYIGINVFIRQVCKSSPTYLSIVLQLDGKGNFVSCSPFQSRLNGLESIHQTINSKDLTHKLSQVDYKLIYEKSYDIPGNKRLLCLDFQLRKDCI